MKQILLFTCLGISLFFSKTSFGQNTNPNAADDFVTVCENSGTINIAVQNNDTDPEANALTTSIYNGPMNGTATLVGDSIDYTPSTNFSGNDTIIYVICDNGSPSLCDTAMLIITVQPAPIADAESDETICRFDSIQIGTPASMGVTYSWSPASGLSSTTVAQPYASPSVTTTYFLVATNSTNGCQARDTMILTINPVPVANAGPDHVACEGDSVMLGTPGTANNTYYWSPIAPLDWNSIPQPMASPSTTTTFTLTVTTTPTGCQSKDSVVVTINPSPATDAGPNQTICNGDSVQIGSAAIAGNTYNWSPPTGLSSSTVAQPMASPAVTTTYTLTVTNSTTGCNDTSSVTVTIGTGAVANAGPDRTICNGIGQQIGTPAIAGNTYSWSPATGLSSSTVAQPMANPATTTSYTLTVTNTTSGCVSTDVVVVTVGSTPIANAGADQTICSGNNVVIGSAPVAGNSYSWSPSTGLSSSTVAQPVASPATTTTYVLTVTQNSSGCSATDNVVVTVNPAPFANAGPDQVSCSGDSVQIGSPALSGVTYSWSPVTGLSSSTVAQPMAAPLVTTSYTVTLTNSTTGCTNTDVVVVTFGLSPLVNAGPDRTICSNDSVQIGTPAIAGNTYSWSPAIGLSSSTAAQPMASPAVTVSYTLTVTQTTSGCQAIDSVIVNVNPAPFADAGPDQTSCNLDSVQIGTPALPGVTYSWSPVTGLSNPVAAQPMAAPIVTTTYTLTITNTTTGCTNTDVVTISVGTAPIVSAGPDRTICSNDSVQIGLPAIPGNTYSWTPATGLSDSTSAQPMASPAVTTTYILILTNTASGCQTIDSVIVNVNPAPVADAGADQISCSGDSVLIGTPGTAGNLYTWLPVLGLSSPVGAQVMAAPSTTTSYTLTVVNVATACTNTDVVIVSIGTTPVVNAGPDQTICSNDSVQIGTVGASGNTYSWSPATGLSSASVAQPVASPATTTTYTLTVTNTTGCQAIDSVVVNVNPIPFTDAGPDQSSCTNDSVQIGTAALAGNTYSWSPATGLSSATVAQPMANPSVTTSYTLTVTNSSTGCSTTDVVVVNVLQPPVANAGPDTSVCVGDSIAIGAQIVSGNTYSWSPSTGLSSSTAAQPNASPATTTTYTLTVTNAAGCTSTDAITVTVNPSPTANAGPNGTICNGDSVSIGGTPAAGNTYSWSPAAGLSSSTVAQPMASPSSTTTYTLTVTNSSGCSTSNIVTVTVNTPFVDAGENQSSCGGGDIMLGTTAVAGYTYLWTPSEGLSSATVAQPIASPSVTTNYTLTVVDTVTGCTASDDVLFKVEGGDVFNAFSPNGDGVNDWWNVPLVDCFDENEVIVINRWGSEVWRGQNYNNTSVRWNGQNLNGTDCTDGTYYYIIKYNDTEKRGWLFIKR
ncbi:MAG: gliding motility-associated C-terminal domain-containing protein [Bacteroidota bacterium]|nr:gliding motility-associated C-terminal domain-containing protein [Bacteroidota bacterium]